MNNISGTRGKLTSCDVISYDANTTKKRAKRMYLFRMNRTVAPVTFRRHTKRTSRSNVRSWSYRTNAIRSRNHEPAMHPQISAVTYRP